MHVYIDTIIKKDKSGYGLIIKPNGFYDGVKYIGLGARIKTHNSLFQIAIDKFIKPPRKEEGLTIYYNPKLVNLDKIENLPRDAEYEFLHNDKEYRIMVEDLAQKSLRYPICETVLLHKFQYDYNYKYKIDIPIYYVKNITYDLELQREQIFISLKKDFEKKIETYQSLFTIIKDENYFTDWYWTVISNNYDLIDPVIPYFMINDYEHVSILSNLFGLNEKESIDFSNYLSNKLKQHLRKLHEFSKIYKQKAKVFRVPGEQGKVALECRGETYYLNSKIFKIINKNYKEYNLNFNAQEMLQLLWCLITRHKYLKIWDNSMQLSKLPEPLIKLRDNNKFDFELFGSVFNHSYNSYCSLFYDIESYFGSKGSYFRIRPLEGNFYVNPPFITNVINKSAIFILESLKNTKLQLNYFIVLPTWDEHGKKLLREYCIKFNKFKEKYDDNDFEAILKLRNNIYLEKHLILCQDKVKYYNFFEDKDVTNITATSILLLGKNMSTEMKDNLINTTKNIYLLRDDDFTEIDRKTMIC